MNRFRGTLANRLRFLAGALLMSVLAAGSARAADNAKFDYQGRMLVNGAPFTGTGAIKAAIVNTTGTVTLWSNDGTSAGGSEPTASIPVNVVNGVFDLSMGDAALGMAPIKAVLFNGRNDLRLRIWFNDGVNGFYQLSPDREFANARTLGLREATEDLTLYVDAATGNDAYSGLAANQAKKTIQAAVNMAPKDVRSATLTIQIAPGVYRELVQVYGMRCSQDGKIFIQGDTTTAIDSTNDPNVRITGSESDITHARVRSYAMEFRGCSGVSVVGILTDDGINAGIRGDDSYLGFTNCNSRSSGGGFLFVSDSYLIMDNCWAIGNSGDGIRFDTVARAFVSRSGARLNAGHGLWLYSNSEASLSTSGDFSQNAGDGIRIYGHSGLSFNGGFSGTIQSNQGYGVRVRYQSQVLNAAAATISGNVTGSSEISSGGASY